MAFQRSLPTWISLLFAMFVGVHSYNLPSFCHEIPDLSIPLSYKPYEAPFEDNFKIYTLSYIMDITKVNDKEQQLHMVYASLKMWYDPRIKLLDNDTFNEYVGRQIIVSKKVFEECLWSPNMNIHFAEKVNIIRGIKTPVLFEVTHMEKVGLEMVSYQEFKTVILNCIMDFRWFPFDHQSCYFLEYNLGSKMIEQKGVFLYDPALQRQLQYDVEVVDIEDELRQTSNFGLNISFSGWKINLKRKLSTTISLVFGPTAMIVVLSWVSFLIPPEVVPGRMALLVTLILVMVSMKFNFSYESPNASGLTALDVWMMICLFQLKGALLQYGILLYKGYASKIRIRDHSYNKKEEVNKEPFDLTVKKWDKKSLILFPIFCLLTWVIYWSYCLKRYKSPPPPEENLVLRSLTQSESAEYLWDVLFQED